MSELMFGIILGGLISSTIAFIIVCIFFVITNRSFKPHFSGKLEANQNSGYYTVRFCTNSIEGIYLIKMKYGNFKVYRKE